MQDVAYILQLQAKGLQRFRYVRRVAQISLLFFLAHVLCNENRVTKALK
jgi:hypothetical protein